MADAYIYDAVRTPRGKGKANGSLHEQTSLQLATQVLEAIRERNNLDTSKVDDVYLGVLSPIGEQGGNIDELQLLKREGVSDFFDLTILVEVLDNRHLNDIMNGLKAKSSVTQVVRVTG